MKSKNYLLLLTSFFIILIVLLIYSYTQVDLNLTLFTNALYQLFQQKLIYLGYFQRNISAVIYLLILTALYIFYFLFLKMTEKNNLSINQIKKIILISSILILAYPAFSHDIFNYMFDARIVTKYNLSPYFFKALDFPNDQWIRFMHWTHRYYPYGPIWILVTLVPSFLGFGKFVFTLGLFKLFFIICYLINCYSIYSIVNIFDTKRAKVALIFYALNPLILIESLISPHNEVFMLTFLLLSLWLLLKQKYFWSVILITLSIGIKYLSAVILPLYFIIKSNFEKLIQLGIYLWILILIPVIISRETYAWYFIPIIGLGALVVKIRHIKILTISISASVLIRYWPYLLNGDYSIQTVVMQQTAMIVLFILTSVAGMVIFSKN